MKRILYSYLLLISLFLFKNTVAQPFIYTVNPVNSCYAGAPILGQAGVTSTGTSTSFSWTIVSPGPPNCAGTFTLDPTAPDGGTITITYPCCGIYTVISGGFSAGNPLPTPGTPATREVTITCPTDATITSNPVNLWICPGTSATLTADGNAGLPLQFPTPAPMTWTWSTGATTQSIAVSPLANTCYTAIGTTVGGCTVSAVACVSVQAATATVSPGSQTVCSTNNATLHVNASTNSTTVQWYQLPNPPGPVLGTSSVQVINPGNPPGTTTTYSAVVTTTGSAGSCTVGSFGQVFIGTSISMTITPSSPSVCPGATVGLTAGPLGATGYTWTNSVNGTTVNGNPIVATGGPRIHTVTADYAGCPGTATLEVFTAVLTPTLLPTHFYSCPGRPISFTFTAGGTSPTIPTYTFGYTGVATPSILLLGTTNINYTHNNPPVNGLPATYTLNALHGGCTGTTAVTIIQRVLQPTLTPASVSVCPGQTFALTGSGGLVYTFLAPTGATVSGASGNAATGTATLFTPAPTFTLNVDSLGCKGSTTTTIQKLILTPTITSSSPNNSVCPGSTFTLNATGGNTYTFSALPVGITVTNLTTNGPDATSSIPTGSFPAIYSVVAESTLGCSGSSTYTVGLLSLNQTLTLTAITSTAQTSGVLNPSVCPGPGNTFTLEASGADSFVFSPGVTPAGTVAATPSGSNQAISYLTNAQFPATFVVTGTYGGCTGTKTIVVNRFFLTTTLSVTPTGSLCAGQPVTVTATGSLSNTYYFLASTAPLVPIASTTNAVVFNPTVATTYSVYADSSGCISSPSTATIGIFPPLSVTVSATSPTVCSGMQATLTVVSAPNYSYTWFSSTSTSSFAATESVVVNPTSNTTYTVRALDPGGCTGDGIITVSVNPTASLTINALATPSSICRDFTTALTATGAQSYTWFPSTFLSGTTGSNVVASPSVSMVYTVNGDNSLGCYGSTTVGITLVTLPSLTVIPSTTAVCTGYTSTLTAFGALTYTWTGSTLTPVYQQSVAVGVGFYRLYASNGACIDSSHTQNIVGAPDLIIGATPSSYTTCIANNIPKYSKPVFITASGGTQYSWAPFNPATVSYSIGANNVVIPPASTCYTVTGFTSVCSGFTTVCISVIPQFTMNVVPPLPAICTGDSLKLSIVNIATTAVGPTSAFTYSWTEPETSILSLSNPLSPTVVAFPPVTSTYSVEMRDSRNCVSIPRLVTVTVYPRPETAISIPTINSVPTNTVCYVGTQLGEENNLITLTANNANTGLPFGIVPTYTWLPPNEYLPSYNPIQTPPNSNVVTVNARIRLPAIAVYTLVSGYNGIPGCVRRDTVSVRVVDCRAVTQAVVKFTSDQTDTICARHCITYRSLTDTAAGGPQKLQWTFFGGAPATSTEEFPTVCYNLPGQFNVILKVTNPFPTNQGGSTASGSKFAYMKVVDVPNVEIIAPGQIKSDTTVRFGQSVSLSGSGALSYMWSPAYNITSLTNPKVTVNPFQTTQYVLTGYNSKTCASADTINVIVIEDCGEMYVPNAFSPNGDRHNDELKVQGICLQSLTFMIFNRWGEKVFETIDQSIGWDGTYRGEKVNSGVFVYRLEGKTHDGKGYSSKGNITLIR